MLSLATPVQTTGTAMIDDVVPRYLVIVDEQSTFEFDSEHAAITIAESMLPKHSVEVVRSVRRWETDDETGEMLEVGEKLKEQTE